jgi:competence protein ComEA
VLRKGQGTAPLGAPRPPSDRGASPDQPVDLNTATLQQLDGLPGVGPVLAQRIIDWRTEHNRFSSVDELTEVSGIGERTLAELRALVRV